MRGFNHREGFTLIELMVALGIFTILIAIIYTFLSIHQSATWTSLTNIELSQDARLGIDRMIKELRHAQRSTISIPDGSYINFQVPGNSNTIQYSQDADEKQLIRTEAETDTVLCKNVQSIQFDPSLFSGNMILITLQTQKISLSGRNLSTTLNIRLKARN